jgi:hypothetical protein
VATVVEVSRVTGDGRHEHPKEIITMKEQPRQQSADKVRRADESVTGVQHERPRTPHRYDVPLLLGEIKCH